MLNSLSARLLHISELSAADIEQWNRLLCKVDHSARAFLSPEFCFATQASQGNVELLQILEGGIVIAVVPIQKEPGVAGLLGAYRQVGCEISDHFQVVCAPDQKIDLRRILAAVSVASLYATHVPITEGRNGLEVDCSSKGYRLILGAETSDMAAQSKKRSPKYWNDAERCRRRIEREIGPIDVEWNSSRSEHIEWLIDCKLQQYTRTKSFSAALFKPEVQKILSLLHSGNSGQCKGVLSVLSAGHELMAMHFGIQTSRHLHYWFPAYDARFAKYSPGKVLLTSLISNAANHSVEVIDFGEGCADYKEILASDAYELGKIHIYDSLRGSLSTLPRRLEWFFAARRAADVIAQSS